MRITMRFFQCTVAWFPRKSFVHFQDSEDESDVQYLCTDPGLISESAAADPVQTLNSSNDSGCDSFDEKLQEAIRDNYNDRNRAFGTSCPDTHGVLHM